MNGRDWWLENSRTQKRLSEQSPIHCRGTESHHSVDITSEKQKFTGDGEEFYGSFLEPSQKPKDIYTDNSLEFGKSCEEYHGIIEHPLLFDQKQTELQNEPYDEKKREHQPYYCNLDWMKSGGQIQWNAITICRMSKPLDRREISIWTKIWRIIQRTN